MPGIRFEAAGTAKPDTAYLNHDTQLKISSEIFLLIFLIQPCKCRDLMLEITQPPDLLPAPELALYIPRPAPQYSERNSSVLSIPYYLQHLIDNCHRWCPTSRRCSQRRRSQTPNPNPSTPGFASSTIQSSSAASSTTDGPIVTAIDDPPTRYRPAPSCIRWCKRSSSRRR